MPRGELREVPSHAHFLAWDERRRKLVAYDAKRRFIGVLSSSSKAKRQSDSCSLIDQGLLKRMDGYHFIEEVAAKEWGSDWDRMITNPVEYPDKPASVCVASTPQSIILDSSPSCTSTEVKSSDVVAQSSGNLALAYQRGTTTDVRMSIIEAAVFPSSEIEIAGQLTMPPLTTNMESFPAAFTLHNQITQTADVNKNSLRDTSVAASASAGQTCNLALTNTTCTGTGTGKIQVEARGWVWVNYPEPRSGHYKWALSIEATIADPAQRASSISYKATANSWGITRAVPNCAVVNTTNTGGNGNGKGNGAAQENLGTSSKKVNPVLIAVPVTLAILAIILGIVAFYIWRRRRSAKHPRSLRSVPGDGSGAGSRQMSSYPQVTPMYLPPTSSIPGTNSFYSHSHGRGPSMDHSAILTVSSSQGHVLLNEKGRPMVPPNQAHPDMFSPGSSTAMRNTGVMSPGGVLPPAYSESAGHSVVAGSHSTSSGPARKS
ncbi:hypothetical protein BKA62DRAFT_774130 [Auriculariales sp. MPI-PUGE-AT-0066]|nr:hypothetical protein BKA62DRAFT_774130 [Auriculariales sp. MPI-PUGE-AT-0066]